MPVTVKIGKQEATISRLFGDIVVIRYQGKDATVNLDGWKKMSGTLEQEMIDKVKKAVGKK